jgi:1-pyrroline-5-carboxylate dehydrogenase
MPRVDARHSDTLGESEHEEAAMQEFRTEPYSDFSEPGPEARYRSALVQVEAELGRIAPLVIGGERVITDDLIRSVDPSRPSREVGRASSGSAAHVDQALEAAWEAFGDWAARPVGERAEIVSRIGDLLADRKYEMAAWQSYEAGKNWAEAEADVAEAIDFCHYYALQATRMDVPTYDYPGERNESFLIPLGAGVVIPPWNFPLAILVGMTVGPVVAGNTVVLKPASATPLIGSKFMEVAAEAGIPPGVINYLPGSGAAIGDVLVDHPRTRFVNFTGSKEVGLRIGQRSAVVQPGQTWLKRAFMEMGGKDALIVDETADLEAAAAAVVASAYGYQGQKCSACSRLIAVEAIHDDLLERVVAAASGLEIGPPSGNHAVGPVITDVQHRAILDEIERGRAEADLVLGGQAVDLEGGYYLEPTIFRGVRPDARLAQHEIFGPVLSVLQVADFDEAIAVGNGTEFGLTGGVFSQDRDRVARATREFHVGNLYINRKITGALVGIQPFGGFNMSGSNAKAGGPDYLRLFMEMKTVAERL